MLVRLGIVCGRFRHIEVVVYLSEFPMTVFEFAYCLFYVNQIDFHCLSISLFTFPFPLHSMRVIYLSYSASYFKGIGM